jgi:transaldolase/glucose-6-phosphate isomerase
VSRANPLKDLSRFGVSVWYDNISRGLLQSGELARMIEADGLRGVTSNPTIFEKAIGSSQDYDEEIRLHARHCPDPQALFETLAVLDIRAAADLLRSVYKESRAHDGYVSIELPPALAQDPQASHREAARLHEVVDRPNVMIKIPGTQACLSAIEATIADGIPVNVTLLFSQRRYAAVVEAFLKGLEKRAARGKDVSAVASVASFFVSRVDTMIDAALPEGSPLRGRAAVANAKLAYQIYKREFSSARFAALARMGAQPQRLLWASTGAKNPAYRDVVYVEELIGESTVNTMPPATVDAFRNHGVCRPSLEEDLPRARADWQSLKSAGIDTDAVTARLEEEGLKAFAKSYETLMGGLSAKREMILAQSGVVEEGLAELKKAQFAARLWRKDASLWGKDKDQQKLIKNSLGWLTAPEAMAVGLGAVRTFAAEVRQEGFDAAVVLGMGGSSLACEVLRRCLGPVKGFPVLEVLDSTNPGAVAALEARMDLSRTLFIVSSKSGSTIEPNCMFEYFYDRVAKAGVKEPGKRFAAITDCGTSLEKLARSRGLRRIFTNPSDVGGRYSALTYFGLVPAAVMGADVDQLLDRARAAARAAAASVATEDNPALRLGAALGCHARQGRDKMTLSLPPSLESFGLWIEQLVAESTGKEGKGVIPVHSEPLGAPSAYGADRLFVRLSLPGAPDQDETLKLARLEKAGHPVVTLELRDHYDLGGQFFLWEAATAAAGFLLGVNPFDQPDVQRSKDRTQELLGGLNKGALARPTPDFRAGGLAAFGDKELRELLGADRGRDLPLREALAAHVGRLKPGDYCVILAYAGSGDETRRRLEVLQGRLRALTTAPVLIQYGPRYLHSTGQLHKGGGRGGLFLQVVEQDRMELPIPGADFSFGALHRAQAQGDFAALLESGRRILRLELGPAGADSLQALANASSEIKALCPS